MAEQPDLRTLILKRIADHKVRFPFTETRYRWAGYWFDTEILYSQEPMENKVFTANSRLPRERSPKTREWVYYTHLNDIDFERLDDEALLDIFHWIVCGASKQMG